MSSDRTPADVIAAAFSVGRGVTNSPEALAARVLDALAAAGFRVVPEPDDTTRAEIVRWFQALKTAEGPTNDQDDRMADLLAAAYLSGDREERPTCCWSLRTLARTEGRAMAEMLTTRPLRAWSFIAEGSLDYGANEDHDYGVLIGADHWWCAGCLSHPARYFTEDAHPGWPNLTGAPNGLMLVIEPLDVSMAVSRRPLCPRRSAEDRGQTDGWKREAMAVIGVWEKVWVALGEPGALGALKSTNSLAAVQQLVADRDRLRDAVAAHHDCCCTDLWPELRDEP